MSQESSANRYAKIRINVEITVVISTFISRKYYIIEREYFIYRLYKIFVLIKYKLVY